MSKRLAEIYAALWIGALLVATTAALNVFPYELEALAERFFWRYQPLVQA